MTSECRDKDIVITPTRARVRVHFAGEVIADTDEALDLKEGSYPVRIYLPRSAVRADFLSASDHHTSCPFKGVASYQHLRKRDVVAENAVWFYPRPCDLVAPIADHVSFWGDQIEIEVLPA